MNNKQLDSYSLLIVSKYLHKKDDYINVVCVNSKFKETTEKLRFNPISITSLKLFPKIETQHLYSEDDIWIEGVDKYEIWYNVDFDSYSKYTQDRIKYHHIKYTKENRLTYGNLIPSDVTELADNCFNYSNEVNSKTVTIPNHVTSIGKCCFSNSQKLENIFFANQLIAINEYEFNNCSLLTSINLSSTIKSLGNNCFSNCLNLKSIDIPNSVTEIQHSCFSYCYSLQTIKFPLKLQLLESDMFNNCSSLTYIELPPSLKQIGDNCFFQCDLQSIEIPNSVKLIGIDCFVGCMDLMDLKLSLSSREFLFKVSYFDSILYSEFGVECKNIVFTKNDVIDQVKVMEITRNMERNFVVPSGVVEIMEYAFFRNRIIKSITIPTSVTSIGENCFNECESLTSLSIPNSVKSIKMNCYRGCNQLKELILPLNENNKYPFKVSYGDYLILKQCGIDCENIVFDWSDWHENNRSIIKDIPLIAKINNYITETTLQNNIIALRFNHLPKSLINVVIPTNITYLCNYCFKEYLKLQSITLPTTIKYIGKHLIDGCTLLTELNYDGNWNDIVVSYDDHLRYKSIGLIFNNIEYTKEDKIKYGNVIPSIVHSLNCSCYNRSNEIFHISTHITLLDKNMFASYSSTYYKIFSKLQTISIPTSIITIPKQCFYKCYSLTSIELPSTLKTIQKRAFSNCVYLESIIIPSSVTSIEENAFEYCYSLTRIVLPTTITTFGIEIFKGCDQLKSILNVPDYCF